jgi:hypothetical protein
MLPVLVRQCHLNVAKDGQGRIVPGDAMVTVRRVVIGDLIDDFAIFLERYITMSKPGECRP